MVGVLGLGGWFVIGNWVIGAEGNGDEFALFQVR